MLIQVDIPMLKSIAGHFESRMVFEDIARDTGGNWEQVRADYIQWGMKNSDTNLDKFRESLREARVEKALSEHVPPQLHEARTAK